MTEFIRKRLNGSFIYLLLLLFLIQCIGDQKKTDKLFEQIDPADAGINFKNELFPSEEFNMYLFRNFYNGGGVAIGDVNNDGRPDIFFTGNMTSNRLYLNVGDFQFEDITEEAGLLSDGFWSTGVSMADVNGDGWLDIFVTISGEPGGEQRHNRLYINNGVTTSVAGTSSISFAEQAKEYNIADSALSTHGVFFDYNNDGRLDLYLLSNSVREVGGYENVLGKQREIADSLGASKLYRNEGSTFTDVTEQAGIYSSIIGFGLSAAVSDINKDGFADLYIANDFFERDYLYINNGDGTFTESLEEKIRSSSFSSMGSDIADINNDGWPDIYVTDMLPGDEVRLKSKMTIESWEEYQQNLSRGFHHKFTRNTLQLNRAGESFSEIGRYANVHATDWSWAALIADFDHSGENDIFVTNGIYKDLLDQDYIERVSNPDEMRRLIQSGEENVILNLMDQMSSQPVSNAAFRNEGDLKFTNQADSWGLDEQGFSSGAAWGDLDGDGDLDLVVNDVNNIPRIYKNRSEKLYPDRNWLQIKLIGEEPNTFGIGTKLHVWSGDQYWFREHFLQRGFQSSVEPGFFVGLGETSKIDSLAVIWPDGRTSRMKNLTLSEILTVSQSEAQNDSVQIPRNSSMPGDFKNKSRDRQVSLLKEVSISGITEWKHNKFEYNDFDRERMLFHKRSTEGPALCTGDINSDGQTDFYIGGARGQSGVLWIQDSSGEFELHQSELFQADATSEDTDCAFFDATGNGVDDLYVVSGGNSFSSASSALTDRFYLNDGTGKFQKTSQILPTTRAFEPGSVVAPHDFNADGIMDLFVGIRLRPFAVGTPVNGYFLEGDGTGNFMDVTEQWGPALLNIGMITDAIWTDLSGDSEKELVIAGEWMPIRVFTNNGAQYSEITESLGLSETSGWWNSLTAGDIDGDGRTDLVATNHGYNSMFNSSREYPVKMLVGDISRNGMIEQVLATEKNGEYYPVALRHDIIEAIPSLRDKYPNYTSYAGQSIEQIFSRDQLDRSVTLTASQLGSGVFWNRADSMQFEDLPPRAQISPLYTAELLDLDGDENPEIILGGNLYDVKPQVGPYDASKGVVLSYKNGELYSWPPEYSGLNISGEIRSIETIQIKDTPHLIVVRYNDYPVLLQISN